MNAITKRDPTAVQASEDVVAIHRRMLRRQRFNRILAYVIGILIVLWILVPVFFIASMAFTTPESVRAYPKGVLPFIPLSMDTMNFFLSSEGVIPGITNSIIVAIITLALSTLIAAPAGYATSRYIFPGRDFFRLSILAVRAFPNQSRHL
jgi:multiple sugar transport system permease protein